MSHMVERIVPVDPIRAALGVGSGFVTLSLLTKHGGSGFVTLSLSQSMAIRGHPLGNPRPSEAIRGNPRPSDTYREPFEEQMIGWASVKVRRQVRCQRRQVGLAYLRYGAIRGTQM